MQFWTIVHAMPVAGLHWLSLSPASCPYEIVRQVHDMKMVCIRKVMKTVRHRHALMGTSRDHVMFGHGAWWAVQRCP